MLESGLFSILLLGFTLGIKHSTEPDHIIAVSTIASQTKRLFRSSLSGVFWGLGHTLMLLLMGVTVIALKQHIPNPFALSLELVVGIMLLYLGFNGFRDNQQLGSATQHYHKKSFIIGGIHGLAGSAALIVLTTARAQTEVQAFLFILIFGAGTIIGMLLFTTVLGLPFLISSAGQKKIPLILVRASSAASILYGIYYIYEVSNNLFF
ncbi:high-affinity nickel-transport protein [Cytobacillus firmus]|uniref:Nickel/cobalt efflux system n=2 Tax=Cytobacillus TaxID=2675230 RepID=A0A366JSA5_CYTFI|nr:MULTISPECIES: urease accessory protein UreH [Cytobacillus]RBP91460.1 high-affinity nickel-transport protein [Cytobacillus firmus]TDX41660.1 high-affinity nickel-transport protein [Cytobacillus oceanisediminis]